MLRATVTLSAGVIGVALAAGPAQAQAPIVTDGTMGARAELNGSAMQIPHTLGTQAGPNLFHSFQRFNIPTGSSATFTGPGGIDNVISRVTGGEASTIDGAFRSTIPGAAVWLTNPAGVTFGANASLDVPASFHASTADEIRFPDGGRFSADLGAASTLSVAAPEAFGFLSSNPAPLKVERGQLSVANHATLSLAAGEIDIQGDTPPFEDVNDFVKDFSTGETGGFDHLDTLRAPSGTINLASVAGPAEVKTDGTVSGNTHGAIRLTDGALVNASGDGAGVVRIRGGEVTSTGSYVYANNTGRVAGAGGIDISADRISLQADDRSVSAVRANTYNRGPGAPINMHAQDVTIQNSQITSVARAAGKAGNIEIHAANQMTLDNFAFVGAGTVFGSQAAGGDITVKAGNLVIRDQSLISTTTNFSGPAGNIDVSAGTVLVDSASIRTGPELGLDLGTLGIGAPPLIRILFFHLGTAGNITVSADEIRLINRAQISSSSEGPREGGTIILKGVSKLFMSDGAEITTQSGFAGGGNIEISGIETIVLRDGSRIGVDVVSGGARAGDIKIGPRFLVLDRSAISATADAGSGGGIRVESDFTFRSPDSEITARAGPAGIAGTVVLTSPETDVTGDLAQLPGDVVNAAGQMQERCAVRGGVEGSSFTIAGPEARSPALEGYLAGTYTGIADETAAATDGSLALGLAFPAWTLACSEAR